MVLELSPCIFMASRAPGAQNSAGEMGEPDRRPSQCACAGTSRSEGPGEDVTEEPHSDWARKRRLKNGCSR